MSQAPRSALVTGGSRRVGRATCLALARRGYDLLLTFRTAREAAEETREEVEKLGRRCSIFKADFDTQGPFLDDIGNVVESESPNLSLLVHNASTYEPCPLASADVVEHLRRDLRVHVETPLLLTQRLRSTLEKNQGSIVFFTDEGLARPRPDYLTYQVAKSGTEQLMHNLARELAPRVRVNAVAPGAVAWAEGMNKAEQQAYLSRVPLGRVGTVEDAADAVVYLAEAAYVTGETIRLDGGRHLR
jgi:pteridine reductase